MYSYFGTQFALFLIMSLFKIYFCYFFIALFDCSLAWAAKKQKSFLQDKINIKLGTLSLNLKRLNKIQTYKLAIYLSLSSIAVKKEILKQKFFFKELIAYMLYNFSEKELNTKGILKQSYLNNLNLFVNQGSIKAIKIKNLKI